MIEREPALAVLAVEACYYVFALSGADGRPDLGELLTDHDRLDAVDAIEFTAFDERARVWADSVRRQR